MRNGGLVETYTYDLGGKPFITTTPGKTSPQNRFLYNGRDYSSFTGLYDFRNRFYQPATSRFIQPDPIGFAGGNHLYRFAGNSAVNAGDPLGLVINPLECADCPSNAPQQGPADTTSGTPGERVIVTSSPLIINSPLPGITEIHLNGVGSPGVDVPMLDTSISEGGYNLNGASPGDGSGSNKSAAQRRAQAIAEGATADANGTIVWSIDKNVNVMGLYVFNFVSYGITRAQAILAAPWFSQGLRDGNLAPFGWRV